MMIDDLKYYFSRVVKSIKFIYQGVFLSNTLGGVFKWKM